jgi:hypothetical protein
MTREYNESDWRVLRQLHPVLLERLCGRILKEIAQTCGDSRRTNHQRYLDVYRLVQRRDEDVTQGFNDMRRTRMLERVMAIKRLGLLTDEEFARFSPEIRSIVSEWLAHAALS